LIVFLFPGVPRATVCTLNLKKLKT